MIETRLGGLNANKRCFARVAHLDKVSTVSAGIFTARVKAFAQNGRIDHRQLSGNADEIKNLPIEEFVPPEDGLNEVAVAYLYTISGKSGLFDWESGGRNLASDVYAHLMHEAQEDGYLLYISTLSPIRNFNKWLQKQRGWEAMVFSKEVETANALGKKIRSGMPLSGCWKKLEARKGRQKCVRWFWNTL